MICGWLHLIGNYSHKENGEFCVKDADTILSWLGTRKGVRSEFAFRFRLKKGPQLKCAAHSCVIEQMIGKIRTQQCPM